MLNLRNQNIDILLRFSKNLRQNPDYEENSKTSRRKNYISIEIDKKNRINLLRKHLIYFKEEMIYFIRNI